MTADPTSDDLIPAQWAGASRYGEPTFDDLIPPQPAGVPHYGAPTFDDLIPAQPAGVTHYGEPTFDDLIPPLPAGVPHYGEPTFDDRIPPQPAGVTHYGELTFDDLVPNQGAPWQASSPGAGGVSFGQTIGEEVASGAKRQSEQAGQAGQDGQDGWGQPISPNALPNGMTMAQYNAALDQSEPPQFIPDTPVDVTPVPTVQLATPLDTEALDLQPLDLPTLENAVPADDGAGDVSAPYSGAQSGSVFAPAGTGQIGAALMPLITSGPNDAQPTLTSFNSGAQASGQRFSGKPNGPYPGGVPTVVRQGQSAWAYWPNTNVGVNINPPADYPNDYWDVSPDGSGLQLYQPDGTPEPSVWGTEGVGFKSNWTWQEIWGLAPQMPAQRNAPSSNSASVGPISGPLHQAVVPVSNPYADVAPMAPVSFDTTPPPNVTITGSSGPVQQRRVALAGFGSSNHDLQHIVNAGIGLIPGPIGSLAMGYDAYLYAQDGKWSDAAISAIAAVAGMFDGDAGLTRGALAGGELAAQRIFRPALPLVQKATNWDALRGVVGAGHNGWVVFNEARDGGNARGPMGSANPSTRAAASRGSTLHADRPLSLPDQLRQRYPSTVFRFTKPGMTGQDVEVVGGEHPSQYENSDWPTDTNYADFKPDTASGSRTFRRDQRTKWSDKTHMLAYDPITGKLK